MAKTFLALQQEALHDRFDEQKYGQLVKEWLNEGVRRIYRHARVPQGEIAVSFDTVAGQATYALSSEEIRIRSLRDPLRGPLEEKDIEWIDERGASSGYPRLFALYGSTFVLWPTPNAVVTLERRAVARTGQLVADGALLPLDEDYERLPVYYARALLYEGEEDPEMATYYRNQFMVELQALRSDVAQRSITRHDQQPSMWGGGAAGPRFVEP